MRLAIVHPVYIGCDVSKAHLDLLDAATQKAVRIANTGTAIDEWLATLDGCEAQVILEATGRYDRLLCSALERWWRPYCWGSPARARHGVHPDGPYAGTGRQFARRYGGACRPCPPSMPIAAFTAADESACAMPSTWRRWWPPAKVALRPQTALHRKCHAQG